MGARSRNGCLTCRQRKLKCDEKQPKCTQCEKSNRDCEYRNGLTFRHHQNASLNSSDQDAQTEGGKLPNYFKKDKHTFPKDAIFLPTQSPLQWLYYLDPNSEPVPDHDLHGFLNQPPAYPYLGSMFPGDMPLLPRVGLDALSTVAATTQDNVSVGGHGSPVNQLSLLLNPIQVGEDAGVDQSLENSVVRDDEFLDPALSAHVSAQYVKTNGQGVGEIYHLSEFDKEIRNQPTT